MASSKQKLPSFLRCCMKTTDKSKKDDVYYIQKLRTPRNSLDDDKNGNIDQKKPFIRRTDRAPEMTALEFEDDDEGFCIGYARILKTPQKERRIKLKPIRKMQSEEEEEDEDFLHKNGMERASSIIEPNEHFVGQQQQQNHISIVDPPSATPVHQKMAMIATVQPFKQQQNRNGGPPTSRRKEEEEFSRRGSTDGFRIEDVTDDPKYKDYGNGDDDAEFEEGALVEYCRSKVVKPSAVLKQPPLVVRRPSSTVRTQNMPTSTAAKLTSMPIFGRTKAAEIRPTSQQKATTTPLKEAKLLSNGNGGPTTAATKADKNAATATRSASLLSSILPMHSSRRGTTTGIMGSSGAGTLPPKAKLVSGGSSTANPNNATNGGSRWRSNSSTGAGQLGGGRAAATTFLTADPSSKAQMAHVIDVEVGQPCSKMAICNCYGFRPHSWRKVCIHCKCERSDHELGPTQALNVYERLGIKPSSEMAKVLQQRKQSQQQGGKANNSTTTNNNSNDVATIGSVQHGYAWVPPGISRIKVEDYMSQLPNHMIPRLNSIGEKNRERQLMVQLPRQDLSIAYCKHLKTPQERRLYEEFVNARNEVALDIGYVNGNIPKALECRKCRGVVERNEMAVVAPKLGESTGWHPACFACQTCDQLLVDLTYCVRDDKVYCERHFAELHKPRCSACDELIFSGEYTKAMNKDWHSDHFCCWQCDGQLTGQRYILRDDHPYCIKCYEEIFANVCDECQKHIGIDSKDLSYKEKHWHEECFLCYLCKVSLVDKPFGSKTDRIYCSNCYDQAFATRCDGCGEIFKAGMKKMEYKGKQWHDKCFVCAHCKSPIGTRSFIPKNEEVFCANCYEEKFATRCCKCKKVISTGGVTYKNEPWHRECFCCTNCNSSLAGQRFTSKDEKPYCADCYGELFAKRCSACVKPITGIGGAKFISFEDRHWHNDCFVCSQCSLSLVGKGFITDGADILCAECAKARLMAANS